MGAENIFETFLNGAGSIKGVAIDRDSFLASTFKNYTMEDEDGNIIRMLDSIITLGPPQAGVPKKELDRMAEKIITKTRLSTTGVSFLTGIPGGLAMAASIPADVLQFYLQSFVLLQKLMFLYGQWNEDFF